MQVGERIEPLYAETTEKWSIFEITLDGPVEGNPFQDVVIEANFICDSSKVSVKVTGFYDGGGVFKIRFMPEIEGNWRYVTSSNISFLNEIHGAFFCKPALQDNHGPVRVRNTFHFAYEDGTSYIPIGTTCYAWTHQMNELEEQTLETLRRGPFNKIRMCIFPKSYQFNENEPVYYPYKGSLEEGWDFTRFNPAFFQHLERRITDLAQMNIEADLILFHPYDRWGFAKMSAEADDLYLRYITSRFSAYRNVWWSLANEYDLMQKENGDWEHFAEIVSNGDPYGHLISIHNCWSLYDYNRPWITHCSIQRMDVYRTAENTNEWRETFKKPIVIDECAYEGNIDLGWGNITGEEIVRRFWEGTVRGGYVGHGETYVQSEDILWWSKGGVLHGTSPDRIQFLRYILEEGPPEGLDPLPSDWDLPSAGLNGQYYLYYFGFNQPTYRHFNMGNDVRYHISIIDTWNMTIEEKSEIFQGSFRIQLPGRPYIAIRMRKI